jgi:hypothetical protein
MTRKEIEKFLGDDFVVKDILEDEKELFAFYVSKEFEESGGNERYALIGIAPFYFNMLTQEKRRLGAFEFHSNFASKKIFNDRNKDLVEPTLEEVIQTIKNRKHINGDEFELIMNKMSIEFLRVSFTSTDFIHEVIESPEPKDIDKFKLIFERAGLEFVRESPNKIIVKN